MTKEKIYPFLSLCVRFCLSAAVGIMTFMLPSVLTAQEAQDEEDADLVELDIFTVEATETVGYRATNAISATRLNTSLLEIPQTINVLTADFLEDVNAFSPVTPPAG